MGKYKYYYLHPVKSALAKRKRILHHAALLGSPLLFLLAVTVGGILAPHSYAASYTWDGGGATNNWSDCDNWSTNVCPVAADSVTFNATSTKDSTIDGAWGGSLTGLTIASGYTGTITMDRSLTMTGAFSQAAGNFTATSQTLDLNSTFALSAGNFTASSGTMSVALGFTISGTGAFNANGGTLAFDGTASAVIACDGATFNLVQISHTSNTKTISSNCSLPLGVNPEFVTTGTVFLSGTLSGAGTLTAGILRLNSGSVLSGFSGYVGKSTFQVEDTTADFGSYTTFDVNGGFTLGATAGFIAPSGTATFASVFNITSPAAGSNFNANGGIIEFDGGSATIICNDAVFNFVQFAQSGGTKTISAGCNLPMGDNPAFQSTVNLSGTLTGSGTLTAPNFVMNSGSLLSGFSGLVTAGTLTINGTADFGSYTTFDMNQGFILNSGAIFTAPSGVANFASTFTVNSGATFNANGGTVVFDGGSNAAITCNNAIFNLVEIVHTSQTKTISDGCVLPLGNDPTSTGTIVLNGVLTGTGTLTRTVGGTTINATGNITGFTHMTLPGMVVNGATLDFSSLDTITSAGYSQTGGTVTSPGGQMTMTSSGGFSLNSGAVFISAGDIDANNDFILLAGSTFTAPSGNLYAAGAFTINTGAVFNANNGTLVIDGASGTLTCNNAVFDKVRFAHTATKTVNAGCNFNVGNGMSTNGAIMLYGTISGSGTFTSGNLWLYAGSSFSGFTGLVVTGGTGLTISSITFDASNYALFSINASFILSNGAVFTAPPLMSSGFNVRINVGTTFNANGGVYEWRGGGTFTCNGAIFNLVRFINATVGVVDSTCNLPVGHDPVIGTGGRLSLVGTLTGSGTITSPSTSERALTLESGHSLNGFSGLSIYSLVVNGDADFSDYSLFNLDTLLTINTGATFSAPPLMSVGGAFTNNAGTFQSNSGTVILNGTNHALTGDIEFHNLTKTTSGIVTVGAGNTITTTGLFKLSGPSLVSSAPGSEWNINMQGSTNICGVSVTDSNSIGNAVVAYQSESYSANPGWVFLNGACPGSGGGGGGGGTGGGGEPVSTVTNYTNAQAAATASAVTPPNTSLPPYYGLPSTLAKTVDTIPGSREALRAFLRFVGVTGLIIALTGGVIWFVASKRRKDEDEFTIPAHWQGTRLK